MYWDDLTEGTQFATSERSITQEDVAAFANLSGDTNPLHLDTTYAADTRYHRPIAHGLFILSVASGLAMQAGILGEQVTALATLEWRFREPVYIDDRIHAKITVKRLRSLPSSDSGLAILAVEIINHKDSIVQTGSWQVLMQRCGK